MYCYYNVAAYTIIEEAAVDLTHTHSDTHTHTAK